MGWNGWFWSATPADWILAIVGSGTLIAAACTLKAIRDQVAANIDAANAAKDSADGLQSAERAYVSIRHREASDMTSVMDFSFHSMKKVSDDGRAAYRLDIRIANTGRTPAHIHGGVMRAAARLHQAKPTLPTLIAGLVKERGHVPGNFLHAGDSYREKLTLTLSADDIAALNDRELWIVGFVQYSDAFGKRHKAGYCRRVNEHIPAGKNSLFVDKNCEPYNYDIQIDDEGNPKTRHAHTKGS